MLNINALVFLLWSLLYWPSTGLVLYSLKNAPAYTSPRPGDGIALLLILGMVWVAGMITLLNIDWGPPARKGK